ncbi:MAG: DUF2007 domain-containing protein [Blastocatellales bacterium]
MSEEQEINYVALAHFPNSVRAGIVKELLENNGIVSIMQGGNFGGLEPLLLPGGFSEITLLVPENDFERAQELYDAFFGEEGEESLPEGADFPEPLEEETER